MSVPLEAVSRAAPADGAPATVSTPARAALWGRWLGWTIAGLGTLALLVGTTFAGFAWLIVPIVLVTFFLARRFHELSRRLPPGIPLLAVISGGIAVLSLLSGLLNGLSDEPYSTPAYASLGWSLYTHPVSFDYLQYGRIYHEYSYDVYLPLLTFIQLPGVDYRWVALGAWAATVALVRNRPTMAAGFSVPWIPVLAANGQNDFVPLLALTAAVGLGSYRGRWAVEMLTLGLKQFANVAVFLYHGVRREYRAAGWAVVASILFLAPFLWMDPGAVYCHVVIGDPGDACQGHPWTFFVFKRNYWLYPTWAVLLFPETAMGWMHRLARGLSRAR